MSKIFSIKLSIAAVFFLGCGIKGPPLPPINPSHLKQKAINSENNKKPLKESAQPVSAELR